MAVPRALPFAARTSAPSLPRAPFLPGSTRCPHAVGSVCSLNCKKKKSRPSRPSRPNDASSMAYSGRPCIAGRPSRPAVSSTIGFAMVAPPFRVLPQPRTPATQRRRGIFVVGVFAKPCTLFTLERPKRARFALRLRFRAKKGRLEYYSRRRPPVVRCRDGMATGSG